MTEIVVTDEAVQKAANVYWETEGNRAVCMRAALEAARPHLQVQVDPGYTAGGSPRGTYANLGDIHPSPGGTPRVQVDREAILAALEGVTFGGAEDEIGKAADAVMAAISSSGEGSP